MKPDVGLLMVFIFGLYLFSNRAAPVTGRSYKENTTSHLSEGIKQTIYGINRFKDKGKEKVSVKSPRIMRLFFNLQLKEGKWAYKPNWKRMARVVVPVMSAILIYYIISIPIPIMPSVNSTWNDGLASGVWEANGNWSAANWPDDNGDQAIFDNTSLNDCNTTGNLDVGRIDMQAGYTGTLTLGGNLTTDDAGAHDGDFTIAGTNAEVDTAGFVIDADGQTQIDNGATLTPDSGNHKFGKPTFTGIGFYVLSGTLAAGTGDWNISMATLRGAASAITLTSGTMSITRGDVNNRSMMFWPADVTVDPNGGTIDFVRGGGFGQYIYSAANADLTLNNVINSGSSLQFYNAFGFHLILTGDLTIPSGTFRTDETVTGTDRNVTVGGAISVTGTLDGQGSTIVAGSFTINAAGTYTASTTTTTITGAFIVDAAATLTQGTGTIVCGVASDIQQNFVTDGDWQITGATTCLNWTVTLGDTWTLNAGVVFSCAGTVMDVNGTVVANTSTVRFTAGAATAFAGGTESFYNITCTTTTTVNISEDIGILNNGAIGPDAGGIIDPAATVVITFA